MSGGQQNYIQDKDIMEILSSHLDDLKDITAELESRNLTQSASATQLVLTRLKDIEQQLWALDESLGHDLTPGSLRHVWRQLDRLGDVSESDVIEAHEAYVAEQSKADMSA